MDNPRVSKKVKVLTAKQNATKGREPRGHLRKPVAKLGPRLGFPAAATVRTLLPSLDASARFTRAHFQEHEHGEVLDFHFLFRPLGKKKTSSSDRFPLKPTRETDTYS